jgi:large subunit ribosomal protein L4
MVFSDAESRKIGAKNMAVIDVYNLQREKIAEKELREDIFQVPIKKHILHEVVVSQLSNRRVGSSSSKSRSEIKASGRKLYRQKGTGRARAGAASSPPRVGGGVVFGPSPRKYTKKVSKKIRKAALRMALSDKYSNKRLVVIADFNIPEIKTKRFVEIMKNFDVLRALIITNERNEHLEKSSKNVRWAKVMPYEGLNVYDIMNHDHLFLTDLSIGKIEEALIP